MVTEVCVGGRKDHETFFKESPAVDSLRQGIGDADIATLALQSRSNAGMVSTGASSNSTWKPGRTAASSESGPTKTPAETLDSMATFSGAMPLR
jgi:hypothetical protein